MDEASEYYVWEVPGKPVRVCLSHQAIDHILTQAVHGLSLLPRHGAEVGGLLLGTVEAGEIPTTRIEEVVPVPIEYAFGPFYAFSESDKSVFRELLRQWQPPLGAPVHAVGFYRTGTRGTDGAQPARSVAVRALFSRSVGCGAADPAARDALEHGGILHSGAGADPRGIELSGVPDEVACSGRACGEPAGAGAQPEPHRRHRTKRPPERRRTCRCPRF